MNLSNSEENEESAVSGESDESEASLLDLTISQNRILREVVKLLKDKNKLLEARVEVLMASCDLLRKELGVQTQAPVKAPQVG